MLSAARDRLMMFMFQSEVLILQRAHLLAIFVTLTQNRINNLASRPRTRVLFSSTLFSAIL